jgi:molybdopterin-guanine dinucleotide biosynthesis protein A
VIDSGVNVAGAVLVGGRSTRMGRDKALIEIGGIPMARRVADAMGAAGCDPVFAVGPANLAAGLDVVIDEFPGDGPLGGILTALHAATPSPVLVMACDLPWVDAATIAVVLAAVERGRAAGAPPHVFMAHADRREPLCAVWMPSATVELQRSFDAGERAVHRVAAQLGVRDVPVPGRGLINVNAPDDLPSE